MDAVLRCGSAADTRDSGEPGREREFGPRLRLRQPLLNADTRRLRIETFFWDAMHEDLRR